MADLVYGAVAEFLRDRFGGRMAERTTDAVVGTTAANVVGIDPERVFLLLVNLSANDIYVRPFSNASATSGIRLEANGGNMTVNIRDDATLPSLGWSAVATGAGSNLFVLEVRRDTLTAKA